jgi:hypothetical protein
MLLGVTVVIVVGLGFNWHVNVIKAAVRLHGENPATNGRQQQQQSQHSHYTNSVGIRVIAGGSAKGEGNHYQDNAQPTDHRQAGKETGRGFEIWQLPRFTFNFHWKHLFTMLDLELC